MRKYKYYEILGVGRDASQEDIRQAFRRLAKITHSDVNPSLDADEKFKLLNEAHRVLGDPKTRADYDASPAECPVCYTHEVIQTVELLYRCRHCGCQFDSSQTINVIEKVERAAISQKLREEVRIFQTTQCSWCPLFYTNEPFLCPYGSLQSSCPSCRNTDRLTDVKRRELLGEEKWWWRMADMLHQVQDKGIMAKCRDRDCFSLNPNPRETTCWSCHGDTLSCPVCWDKLNAKLVLRYSIGKNEWKCPNNAHGKAYKYMPKSARSTYTITDKICPVCNNNLYWDEELWLWRCQAKGCQRVFTREDFEEKPQKKTEKQTKTTEAATDNPSRPKASSSPPTDSVHSDRSTPVVDPKCPHCASQLHWGSQQGHKLQWDSQHSLWKCGICGRAYTDSDLRIYPSTITPTPKGPKPRPLGSTPNRVIIIIAIAVVLLFLFIIWAAFGNQISSMF